MKSITNIGKEIALGKNSRLKCKGKIHFELDLFSTIPAGIIRTQLPEPTFERMSEASLKRRQSKVGSVPTSIQGSVHGSIRGSLSGSRNGSIHESLDGKELNHELEIPSVTVQQSTPIGITLPVHELNATLTDPSEIVSKYPQGILRARIESGSFDRAGFLYIEIMQDNETIFTTRSTVEKTMYPEWVFGDDAFISNLDISVFTIQCKEMRHDAPKANDLVCGKWTGPISSLLGKGGYRLALSESNDNLQETGFIILSIAYSPVNVTADLSSRNDRGVLHVDILEGLELLAVDSNGNKVLIKRT